MTTERRALDQTGDPQSPFADLEDENADLRMALDAASAELARLRNAVAHLVKAIESVRESGALDDDGLLWLDRECAAAANAGYLVLRAALRGDTDGHL